MELLGDLHLYRGRGEPKLWRDVQPRFSVARRLSDYAVERGAQASPRRDGVGRSADRGYAVGQVPDRLAAISQAVHRCRRRQSVAQRDLERGRRQRRSLGFPPDGHRDHQIYPVQVHQRGIAPAAPRRHSEPVQRPQLCRLQQ